MSVVLICGLIWVSLLAWCSKQNELDRNWDRQDFGWDRDERISGSGWIMQWPRDWMWPRKWVESGQSFSGTKQNNMEWNPNGTEKVQEASLPANGKLAVLNNCIWCGKCARIASSHFEMQWWISVVKSQENINSQSVNHAIQTCPVDAIVIEA